jgi:hypothetical protein
VERREADRAAASTGATLVLEIIAKRADHRRVEIVPGQRRRRFAKPLLGKAPELAAGVAVARDGVRTGPWLASEPVGEARFQHGRQGDGGRHDGNRLWACSRRWGAKPSHAGVALKYQYVSLTLTCPREVESSGR